MRLLPANGDDYRLEFNRREQQLFFRVLAFYPRVPAGHHRLSHDPAVNTPENAGLLTEAQTVEREHGRRRVRALLAFQDQFQPVGNVFHWQASRADMEWALHVLNDVRVGSWLALGSPNLTRPRPAPATLEAHAHQWAMEIAGGFEMIFIAALNGKLPPEAA